MPCHEVPPARSRRDVRHRSRRHRWGGKPGPAATLLSGANELQPVDHIAEALWGDATPPDPQARVRLHVYELRQRTGAAGTGLRAGSGGDVLRVDRFALDLEAFENEAEQGHALLAAGDHASAEVRFGTALDLWDRPFGYRTRSPVLDRVHGP